MSGSTDPLLKSMEVPLMDKEENLLLKQSKCPNCLGKGATLEESDDMTETSQIIPTMKYYIKCNSCLTDYTVYLKVRHVTHIATFKNGERVKCQDEILRKVQNQQNLQNSKNEENDT